MARIRTVKPEVAKHELLYELEMELQAPVRFAWVMLFTVCDREGRFKWRPRTLKSDILPYDDVDFSRVLDAWLTRGFLVKYRVGDEWFGCIPTFTFHQHINNREEISKLPDYLQSDEIIDYRNEVFSTREPRVPDAPSGEGKGKEGKGRERNLKTLLPVPENSPPKKSRSKKPANGKMTDEKWLETIKTNPAYSGIDIDRELSKMDAWLLTPKAKGRKKTRGFIINWLNKIDKPVEKEDPWKGW